MTPDRAEELLRGMQSSILNGGRLRSGSLTLDDSRVTAMDLAIEALRAGTVNRQEHAATPSVGASHPNETDNLDRSSETRVPQDEP